MKLKIEDINLTETDQKLQNKKDKNKFQDLR